MVNNKGCDMYSGNYIIKVNKDGNTLNECGPNRDRACIFLKNNISEAMDECNLQKGVCNEFSYDERRGIMKIISPGNEFTSVGINSYFLLS